MFPNSLALLAWSPLDKHKTSSETIEQVWSRLNTEGQYQPPSEKIETVTFPGLDGGGEWEVQALTPKLVGYMLIQMKCLGYQKQIKLKRLELIM